MHRVDFVDLEGGKGSKQGLEVVVYIGRLAKVKDVRESNWQGQGCLGTKWPWPWSGDVSTLGWGASFKAEWGGLGVGLHGVGVSMWNGW